jgi:hypothetical protein
LPRRVQRVVDAPGVDAHGGERGALRQRGDGGAEAGLDLGPEAGDVPVVVATQGLERVGESMHLLQLKLLVFPDAKDDATAGGAEIDGGEVDRGGHGEK